MITKQDLEEAGFTPVPNVKIGVEYPPEVYRNYNWTDPVPEIHVLHEPWYAKVGAMQRNLKTKQDLDDFIAKVVHRFCEPK